MGLVRSPLILSAAKRSRRLQYRCLSMTSASGSEPSLISYTNLKNGIVQLSLNRKLGKNSFNRSMLHDFQRCIADIKKDPGTRVVLIDSSVDNVFSAGADLKERSTMTLPEVEAFVSSLRETFTSLAELPIPSIAAINGVALGGGLELALACDIRIASEPSLLGLPETSLAIIPGAGGTQRLSRIVGIARAKYMVLSGIRLTAKQALDYGLITEITSGHRCTSRALEIAQDITERGPIAIKAAKKAMDLGIEEPILKGLEIEKAFYKEVLVTKDRLEGIASFAEKRKPIYHGQ